MALETSPLETRQGSLFEPDRTGSDADLASLLERLSNRLGAEAVLHPRLVPDHQPEHAVQLVPALETRAPDPIATTTGLRPLSVERDPLPVSATSVAPDGPPVRFRWEGVEHTVARHWGPERIDTGWWRGRQIRRDYFRVETTKGRRFWLYRDRDDGRWYLHGAFD